MVLALSSSCAACRDSLGFYRKVLAASRTDKSPFSVVLLMQKGGDDTDMLNQLGVQRRDTISADLSSMGVSVTPSIWAVSEGADVLDYAQGKLTSVDEGYFIALVSGSLPPRTNTNMHPLPYHLTQGALEYLRSSGKYPITIVDVSLRSTALNRRRRGSITIPATELYVRASDELDPSSHVVLDCANVDTRVCDVGAYQLGSAGFTRVSLLNYEKADVTTQSSGCTTGASKLGS